MKYSLGQKYHDSDLPWVEAAVCRTGWTVPSTGPGGGGGGGGGNSGRHRSLLAGCYQLVDLLDLFRRERHCPCSSRLRHDYLDLHSMWISGDSLREGKRRTLQLRANMQARDVPHLRMRALRACNMHGRSWPACAVPRPRYGPYVIGLLERHYHPTRATPLTPYNIYAQSYASHI